MTSSFSQDRKLQTTFSPADSTRACVFVESQGVMVPGKSDLRHLKDLTNRTVCFMIGSPSERGLNAFSDSRWLSFFRRPFSEDGEMVDAYAAQNCQAIAGEITDLAAIRNRAKSVDLGSRILPETLGGLPDNRRYRDGRRQMVRLWSPGPCTL